jgi:cupin 2 domain-containing protein
MSVRSGNLFGALPSEALPEEVFEPLAQGRTVVIERILSTGQVTPPGAWYDQDRAEWVALLRGGARLLFEGEAEERVLQPGDHLLIPAHARHRVTWTDPDQPTVWLAVHFEV